MRRLAAIIFSDIVGYTALMAENEARAVAARRRHRTTLGRFGRDYGGKIVDENGDELVLTFDSAVDAVNCALAVQSTGIGDGVEIRIGLHVGDVIFDQHRIYGDGVNVASRIRAFAPPGGICVSDEVEILLRNQDNAVVESIGSPELKNVEREIELFAVRGEPLLPSRRWPRWFLPVVASAALVFAAALSLRIWWPTSNDTGRGLIAGFAAPAIAVLPFDNFEDSGDDDVLAIGLVEDLTLRLARWGDFPVIARNSVHEVALRTSPLSFDVGEVGRELGARYVVQGSVRQSGDEVRIAVRLVDTLSGHHVWASAFDRPYRRLLDLQREISQSIAGTVLSTITDFEGRQAMQRDPENLDAWSNTQRGWWHYYRETKDDNSEARVFFERAIEQAPLWAQPHAGMALTHYKDRAYLWSPSPGASLDALVSAATRAVSLESNDPFAHHALGHAYAMSGLTNRMIGAFSRGVELNPSDAMANNCLGVHLGYVGELDKAVDHLQRALALSPHDPRTSTFLFNLASAHFAAGNYEQALAWADQSIVRKPSAGSYEIATAALALLGRIEDAKSSLGELLRLRADLSPAAIRHYYRAADPNLADRLVHGLELAGWNPPEDTRTVFPQM